MNHVGSILSEARRQKGVDIAQVEQDINIEQVYIEALENDDYQKMPAEAYIVGFLRNYSEYLGLNPDDIIRQYKNIKLEDTEVPQEILLPKKKMGFGIKIFLFVSLAVLIVGIVYLTLAFLLSHRTTNSVDVVRVENVSKNTETKKKEVYEITQDVLFEKEVFSGDEIVATIDETKYVIKVLSTSPVLKLNIAGSIQLVELTQTRSFDLNDDATPDIEITVNDISENTTGASISIASGSDIETTDMASNASSDDIFTPTERPTRERNKVLFQGTHPYPVILNATFRGYCLFRTEVDKTERKEQFYQRGGQLNGVQAKNGFRIWASNGNAVKCRLIGGGNTVDLDVGRPGEVIVKDLKWIRNEENGRYLFVEIDVD
jgi:Uncharacterized protein conserved in bacteria